MDDTALTIDDIRDAATRIALYVVCYMDKRWIYEESLQMPFLARFPREIPAGIRSNTVVSNVDFARTLLDFAGINENGAHDPTTTMQGRSFRSVLTGRTPADWQHEVYNRYWMHLAHCDNPAHYGIRTVEHELIFFYGLPLDASGALQTPTPVGWELYDMINDPFELRNVYNDPEYRDVVAGLKARLRELKEEIGDTDDRYPELKRLGACRTSPPASIRKKGQVEFP